MRELKERDIEKYLVTRVKQLGGEIRKVRWIGRRGAPDRLVMMPRGNFMPFSWWVELKAPGKEATVAQAREHNRMRRYGMSVSVINSLEAVDELLGEN